LEQAEEEDWDAAADAEETTAADSDQAVTAFVLNAVPDFRISRVFLVLRQSALNAAIQWLERNY